MSKTHHMVMWSGLNLKATLLSDPNKIGATSTVARTETWPETGFVLQSDHRRSLLQVFAENCYSPQLTGKKNEVSSLSSPSALGIQLIPEPRFWGCPHDWIPVPTFSHVTALSFSNDWRLPQTTDCYPSLWSSHIAALSEPRFLKWCTDWIPVLCTWNGAEPRTPRLFSWFLTVIMCSFLNMLLHCHPQISLEFPKRVTELEVGRFL